MHLETPAILFDFKKNRIRIHKNTLKALDYPDYVLLLINPAAQLIAVKTSDGKDARAHRVVHRVSPTQSFEIYSSTLFKQLFQCSPWDDQRSYRVFGRPIEKLGLVQFDIRDSQVYSPKYKTMPENMQS